MASLTSIYTRTGDGGRTRLGDRQTVEKWHPRVEAYGEVDELNASLGVVLALDSDYARREVLRSVQQELFDLGADLCVPGYGEGEEGEVLRMRAEQVTELETVIDEINGGLPALHDFILPGGSPISAWLHRARTICRRAERRAWRLAETEAVNPQALTYLNRLSDLLFVLAREANDGGAADVLWQPRR